MNPLIVGTRVHCILYGGKDGVVYAIHGEQKPETVTSLASVVMMGGNAHFDIVWENGTESFGIPEPIIHSVQWRILPGVANPEEIKAMRDQAVLEQQRRETEAQEHRGRFCAEVDALKTEPRYAHLEQGEDQSSGKLAAKNIRKDLKRTFPDIKFSVRKEHHGSVNVAWWDGPTTKRWKRSRVSTRPARSMAWRISTRAPSRPGIPYSEDHSTSLVTALTPSISFKTRSAESVSNTVSRSWRSRPTTRAIPPAIWRARRSWPTGAGFTGGTRPRGRPNGCAASASQAMWRPAATTVPTP